MHVHVVALPSHLLPDVHALGKTSCSEDEHSRVNLMLSYVLMQRKKDSHLGGSELSIL